MSFQQKINKLTNSKSWIAFLIIFGSWSIATSNPETEPIMFLFGLILLIMGIYRIYKRIKLSESNKISPNDYLNERYAKGEITKEEYDKIKDDFEKS